MKKLLWLITGVVLGYKLSQSTNTPLVKTYNKINYIHPPKDQNLRVIH